MAEKIIARVYPHRVFLWAYYSLAALILAGSLVIYFYPETLYFYSTVYLWLNYQYISIYLGTIGLAVLLLAELDIKSHEITITNLRIIKHKGFFTEWEYDILWDELDRYVVKRSVFDRLFDNVGTIMVKFKGSDKSYSIFEHVENVNKIKFVMDKFMGRMK